MAVLLKELIRYSTQHRTLYCVMILSVWIFLLIAGMCKYITTGGDAAGGKAAALYADAGGRAGHAGPASASEEEEEEQLGQQEVAASHLSLGGGGGGGAGRPTTMSAFKERCAPLAQLRQRRDDGGLLDGWRLVGVLLVVRHGDRGPMEHVRGVHTIDCGMASDALLNRYRSFLYNSTSVSGANRMYWNKVGPFHGFPLLPAAERACQLGQLTYKGVAQLLHLGDLLHQIYAHPLGLLVRQPPPPHTADDDGSPATAGDGAPALPLLNSDEVVVYSTRYRRTFQSALALLFALLPADKWLALNVHESHSSYFCFGDCACAAAEALRRRTADEQVARLQRPERAGVAAAMQRVGATLLQHTPNGIKDLNEVVDALLTVVCHDAALPCRQPAHAAVAVANNNHHLQSELAGADVINIDLDEAAVQGSLIDGPPGVGLVPARAAAGSDEVAFEGDGGGGGDAGVDSAGVNIDEDLANGLAAGSGQEDHPPAAAVAACVERRDVATLTEYAQRQAAAEGRRATHRRAGLLRAYGMVRHMLGQLLRIISGDRTRLVLYAGHDWTLQHLTAALGIRRAPSASAAGAAQHAVPYAARLAVELYRSEEAQTVQADYYFRLLYNGRDVTRLVEFCEGGRSLRVTRDSRGNKADLCPIENIIRFLHEDYFAPLNATNFKDACSVPPSGGGEEVKGRGNEVP